MWKTGKEAASGAEMGDIGDLTLEGIVDKTKKTDLKSILKSKLTLTNLILLLAYKFVFTARKLEGI